MVDSPHQLFVTYFFREIPQAVGVGVGLSVECQQYFNHFVESWAKVYYGFPWSGGFCRRGVFHYSYFRPFFLSSFFMQYIVSRL